MTDRDANGRFIKNNGSANGNKGGPGRPPKAREERYYEIAMNTVTFTRWEKIINKAAEQAERGDATARKWLSEFLAPQAQRHELSGPDSGPVPIRMVEVVKDYGNE